MVLGSFNAPSRRNLSYSSRVIGILYLVTRWFTGAKSESADTFRTRLVGGRLVGGACGKVSSVSKISSAESASANAWMWLQVRFIRLLLATARTIELTSHLHIQAQDRGA
jgi:hypothetical protein